MDLRVEPSDIAGTVPASPSKSHTHRAMILALLSEGESTLSRLLLSDDTLATLNAVKEFGGSVHVERDICNIEGGDLRCPRKNIDARNSGTTLRLMVGVASLLPCKTILTGDESLRNRPMRPLIDAFDELGVQCISTQGNERAPLMVKGPNEGRVAHIRGDVSSQFISSLLICSPAKKVDTEIVLTRPLKSRPYVDITLNMMGRFNASCEVTEEGFFVPGDQEYRPSEVSIPGDFSSAAFPLVAGALAGRSAVKELDMDNLQGDKVIVNILRRFGADVVVKDDCIQVSEGGLEGAEVDLSNSPDLFPITAVLATQAEGESRLTGAEHLRLKESDRIQATVSFLRKMGAEVRELGDGCIVRGSVALKGGRVLSRGDHRILMAAAVAGLVAEGTTTISKGDCYSISYPSFVQDMRTLGANMEVVD